MNATKKACQKCGSLVILIKNGFNKNGVQRYKCPQCNKTFIINKSSLRLNLSEYYLKKIIGYMIDDVTLEVIARNLSLDIKTIHFYRYLVFNALKLYQSEIKLSGTILIDETFISIKEKQYKIYRPDGKDIRGLSFNQLCIITLVDLSGKSTAKVASRAMALPIHFVNLFTDNIVNSSVFIHDGNPKQVQFMNQFDCLKVNPRKENFDKYSTDLIDSYHSNLKRYLFKHAGYRLKNLQHYLNFFVYRQNFLAKHNITNIRKQIKVKNQMVLDLLKRVKLIQKTITYRTYMTDRGIGDILQNR